MSADNTAVVSVIGGDQKGIVARISTYLAGQSINIETIEQHITEGLFIMTMLVDFADVTVSLDELVLELKRIGRELGMDVSLRLHGARRRKRLAVLVSRERHCLARLATAHAAGELDVDIVVVLSNHPDLEPIASEHGLEFRHFPALEKDAHIDFVMAELEKADPDLVVLARYMQVLPPRVVAAYPNRIINIHPSLLPYYPGPNAYKQAFASGARVCGCTAHFVTDQLDEGPVILQDVFHIDPGKDRLNDIRSRGRELEADVLLRAVRMYVREQLVAADGKVVFRPGRLG